MISSRYKPELYRVVVHPLMSITVASSGVLATVWLIGVNLGIPAPRFVTAVAIVTATIVEAVVGNALYRERAGLGNRLREALIYLGVVYLILSVGRPGPLGSRLEPSLDQMIPLAAVAAAWLIAFAFHNRLRGREALLRAFAGKRGEELRHAVIEHQREMADTVRELRRARGLTGTLFAVLAVLAIFASLDPLGVSALGARSGAFLLLVVYAVGALAAIGSLNVFIQEYGAHGEGLPVPLRFQRRRTFAVVSLIALALVLTFALSRSGSVVPIETIANFFRRLAGLFGGEVEQEYFTPPPRPTMPGRVSPELLEIISSMERREVPLLLRILLYLIERLLMFALVLGGVVLVLGPLVSPSFRGALREFRPHSLFATLWSSVVRKWRILIRLLGRGLRRRSRRDGRSGRQPDDSRVGTRQSPHWRPGLRTRVQRERVVRVFIEITRWGARRGLAYRRSEAAREYLLRIAALHPEHYADAVTVAEIYCEVRFSRRLVAGHRLHDYLRAAKRITSGE